MCVLQIRVGISLLDIIPRRIVFGNGRRENECFKPPRGIHFLICATCVNQDFEEEEKEERDREKNQRDFHTDVRRQFGFIGGESHEKEEYTCSGFDTLNSIFFSPLVRLLL